MKPKALAAAITGDIIASQNLPPAIQDKLVESITTAGKTLQADQPELIQGQVDVFRGEGWQFYCPNPHHAITAGFLFKTYLLGLYKIDTRFSIGIGSIDRLELDRISTSQGEAFLLSGRGLDEISTTRSIAIACTDQLSSIEHSLKAIACLLEASTKNWTRKQALAIALASTGDPNEKSAQRWPIKPISKQAFGKHLANAQWDLINNALQHTQSTLRDCLISPHE